MVVRVEAIYDGGIYELARDNQTRLYTAKIEAIGRLPRTDEQYSYYPVMLRVTDDAGNVTIKTVSDAVIGPDLLLTVREQDIFPLKFIVANDRGEEVGYLKEANSIDLDLGDTNDVEIEMDTGIWTEDLLNWRYRLYIPGTEYGCLIEDRKTSTSSGTITWLGYTWRGLLSQKIIEPPSGQSHLTVSGDANEIIGQVIGDRFEALFVADSSASGIQISNYQFDRYCTVLAGLEKMLAAYGARLRIYYQQGDPGGMNGAVHLCAVLITDWSEELEYSQDGKINFTTRDYRRGINHLICAGTGEEESRTVLHLYIQEDGSIGGTQYYFGLDERTALYSYTSQSDVDQLREDGTERLQELTNYTQMEATIDNVDVDVGDIVGGRDRITGMHLTQPVVGKILRIKDGSATIEYKLKGEE